VWCSIFNGKKEQKLNAVLQQKKLLSLEKETQLQKKVLKVKRNVRIYFPLNVYGIAEKC